MPEEEYVWLPRTSILSFEEITRLTAVFAGLGAGKVRLTGGEPLLRHDLPSLVSMLSGIPGVHDLALTTNGILLSRYADDLRRAGLHRVTVSLDTLKPERMLEFARTDRHEDVLGGIRVAVAAGYRSVKLNSVIVRGFNDDEVTALVEFARDTGVEVRLIEYMDVGGATRWSRDQVVSRAELLDILRRRFGPVEPLSAAERAGAPAERFRLADGTAFGIIASTTAPFCRDCDRSRLTADGTWFLCLYAGAGIDLRDALRSGISDAELAALLAHTWSLRADRGAEERLAVPERGALYQIGALRADPRREMHTRGG